MPTVPVKSQPSVQQAGVPTVFQQGVGLDAFSQGARGTQALGQGISQAANQLEAGVEQAKVNEEKDRLAAETLAKKQARVEYNERANTLLFGDGSAENPGYYSLNGKAALDASPKLIENLQKTKDDILTRYGETAPDLGFELTERETQHAGRIMSHRTTQEKAYAQQLTDASNKEAVDRASMSYNEPETVAASLMEVTHHQIDQGKRMGWDEVVTQSKVQEARTAVVAGAFDAAVKNQDIAAAKFLLEKYGKVVDGPVAAAMTKKLEEASRLKMAFDSVDMVMGTPELDTNEKKFEVIKEQFKDDPQARQTAETQLTYALKRQEQAKAAQMEQYEGEAGKAVDSGGQSFDAWAAQNPDKAAHLQTDNVAMARLRQRERAALEGRRYAPADTDALAVWQSLPPEKLADVSAERINGAAASMSQSQHGQLLRSWKAAQESQDRTSTSTATQDLARKMLQDYKPKGFYNSKRKSGPTQEEINRMNAARNHMNAFIRSTIDTTGKAPKPEELAREAQRLMLQYEDTTDFIFKDSAFQVDVQKMTPAERANFKVDVSEIPPELMAQARQHFTTHGIANPSQDQLTDFFTAEALGDGKAQKRVLQGGSLTPQPTREALPRTSPELSNIPQLTLPPRSALAPLGASDGKAVIEPIGASDGKGKAEPIGANKTTPAVNEFDRIANAVVQIESGGDPNAVSPVGAVGRYQTMPDTLKDPGYGVKPADPKLLNGTPEQRDAERDRVGRDYLEAMLKTFGGNIDNALVAYNWGPGNANKWIAAGSDKTKLPKETREYLIRFKSTLAKQSR